MNTHTHSNTYSHTLTNTPANTNAHGIKRHASYQITLFCRHSTHINMHPNMQIQTDMHTLKPVLRYVQINSHCHTGMLTHPERLLHIQPPRTPELYRLLYTPFTPLHPPHLQINTYPRVAGRRPAPPPSWRHMMARLLPRPPSGSGGAPPWNPLHSPACASPACGQARGWCTGPHSNEHCGSPWDRCFGVQLPELAALNPNLNSMESSRSPVLGPLINFCSHSLSLSLTHHTCTHRSPGWSGHHPSPRS